MWKSIKRFEAKQVERKICHQEKDKRTPPKPCIALRSIRTEKKRAEKEISPREKMYWIKLNVGTFTNLVIGQTKVCLE